MLIIYRCSLFVVSHQVFLHFLSFCSMFTELVWKETMFVLHIRTLEVMLVVRHLHHSHPPAWANTFGSSIMSLRCRSVWDPFALLQCCCPIGATHDMFWLVPKDDSSKKPYEFCIVVIVSCFQASFYGSGGCWGEGDCGAGGNKNGFLRCIVIKTSKVLQSRLIAKLVLVL